MRLRENRAAMTGRSAIFIALEGVVWDRRELSEHGPLGATALAGALDGLRLLARAQVPLYLVANGQDAPTADPRAELARLGVPTAGLITCPHCADVVSRRKALARELRRRARRDGLALASSLFIGDSWLLAEAALGLGCQPVLVMTGRGRAQIALPQTTTVRARTWYAADMALAAWSALAHFLGDDHHLLTLALPQERSTVA
jgi:phosphoglycolate phosphatase-like HAD superfamily hydrolase